MHIKGKGEMETWFLYGTDIMEITVPKDEDDDEQNKIPPGNTENKEDDNDKDREAGSGTKYMGRNPNAVVYDSRTCHIL